MDHLQCLLRLFGGQLIPSVISEAFPPRHQGDILISLEEAELIAYDCKSTWLMLFKSPVEPRTLSTPMVTPQDLGVRACKSCAAGCSRGSVAHDISGGVFLFLLDWGECVEELGVVRSRGCL